jgi:hypothetical protein
LREGGLTVLIRERLRRRAQTFLHSTKRCRLLRSEERTHSALATHRKKRPFTPNNTLAARLKTAKSMRARYRNMEVSMEFARDMLRIEEERLECCSLERIPALRDHERLVLINSAKRRSKKAGSPHSLKSE